MIETWSTQPPEVISARFRTSLGGVSWTAQAAAWESLAGTLTAQLATLTAQMGEMLTSWGGISALKMEGSVAPLWGWIGEMIIIAQQQALNCMRVAAAHAEAQLELVPLSVILANRAAAAVARSTSPLASAAPAVGGAMGSVATPIGTAVGTAAGTVVASGLGGVGAATAAALDAEYARMWAQNTTVMEKYEATIITAMQPVIIPPMPHVVMPGTSATVEADGKVKSMLRSAENSAHAAIKNFHIANTAGEAGRKVESALGCVAEAGRGMSSVAQNAIAAGNAAGSNLANSEGVRQAIEQYTQEAYQEAGVPAGMSLSQYAMQQSGVLGGFGDYQWGAGKPGLGAYRYAAGSQPVMISSGIPTQAGVGGSAMRSPVFPAGSGGERRGGKREKIVLFDPSVIEEEELLGTAPLLYSSFVDEVEENVGLLTQIEAE